MTAKQMPAPAPAAGIPDSLVDSIQSEVAAEASPLLQFLVEKARYIAIGIVLFIAAIIGYWVFASQAESRRVDDLKSLGEILVVANAETRLAKLEAFSANAPDAMKSAVLFNILEAAVAAGDMDKQYAAWEGISRLTPEIKVNALLGMSEIRARQGKYQEALALLDGVAGTLDEADLELVNLRIVLLAEYLGDTSRALAACDAVLAVPDIGADAAFWAQKKAALEHTLQKAPAAGN